MTILFLILFVVCLVPTAVMADVPDEVEWMQADKLHDLGYRGGGVTVARIDSGAVKHDLYSMNTLEAYYEVYDNNGVLDVRAAVVPDPEPPEWESLWDHIYVTDATGHGTSMAGGIKRMAPEVIFVIYEANAVGSFSKGQAVAEALDHLDDNHAADGVDVISISLGTQSPETLPEGVEDSIETSLSKLVSEGVTIVIAAGNDEETTVSWPASLASDYSGIMSIGNVYDEEAAVHWDETAGERHFTSNYGVDLELSAVGVDFYTSKKDSPYYGSVTGNSISTAASAGIIACLIEQIDDVPDTQKPENTGPSFIESQLRDNADDFNQENTGDGTIRAMESMVNWYDYINFNTVQTYGTITDFSYLTYDSSENERATFSESAYDEWVTWSEGFSSVPPSSWTIDPEAGWKKSNMGGQSGPYAKCSVHEMPPLDSGYMLSRDYDTSDADRVEVEFYYMMGFYPGTLTVHVRDQYSNWDLIGTYTYEYAWIKETWSSTSSQYQHDDFAVKYTGTVSGNQWVGVDTHKVKMRYSDDTYKFSSEFEFTGLDYNAYDDATLYFSIYSHPGSENLIVQYYQSGWHTLSSTVSSSSNWAVGDYISSGTFKIRIRGASESRDLSDDTWVISGLYLLVLDSDASVYTE